MDDEGILLGYSKNSKGYRCYNKRLHKLVYCIDIKFDEGVLVRVERNTKSTTKDIVKVEDEQVQELEQEDSDSDEDENTHADSNQQTTSNPSSRITQKNHPASQIIGEKYKGVQTRRRIIKKTKKSHIAFISMVEPKNFNEANEDENWLKSMNEELDQIEKKNTWELVPRPADKNVIGSKWVFKNKINEQGKIVKNKSRLVYKGYAQVEGQDFDETFSLVARMEALRMVMAYACHKNFKVYQMDVKSAFLNGHLEEEVYMEKPEGFSLTNHPNYVSKLKKALYVLKQAP
jgi:hypothetical protein